MFNLFARRNDGASTLRGLYDAAAHSWQGGLERLGYPDAYADLMRRAVPDIYSVPMGQVLDVGTGTGAFADAWLAHAGGADRLDLLDMSDPMLQAAQRRLTGKAHRISLLHAMLGDASVPDAAYDVVLCAHVVEHVPNPQQALRWLGARLRPGGVLILAVSRPHWCTALIRARWGNSANAPTRFESLLQDAGLQDVAILPFPAGPPSRTSCGYAARGPS
jgi:ubiquinone/menaquinone biosynthesis C-methylase UbiE